MSLVTALLEPQENAFKLVWLHATASVRDSNKKIDTIVCLDLPLSRGRCIRLVQIVDSRDRTRGPCVACCECHSDCPIGLILGKSNGIRNEIDQNLQQSARIQHKPFDAKVLIGLVDDIVQLCVRDLHFRFEES